MMMYTRYPEISSPDEDEEETTTVEGRFVEGAAVTGCAVGAVGILVGVLVGILVVGIGVGGLVVGIGVGGLVVGIGVGFLLAATVWKARATHRRAASRAIIPSWRLTEVEWYGNRWT